MVPVVARTKGLTLGLWIAPFVAVIPVGCRGVVIPAGITSTARELSAQLIFMAV